MNGTVEEIRLHGMGGQGVVAAGELIAIAASRENKFCRAFPMYGSARRGAPVLAFAQIGHESEATRSMIYHPNYLLILDPLMAESMDLMGGLKEGGVILFNSEKSADEAKGLFNVRLSKLGVVDAMGIAERVLGRPIPNTAILGALSKVTGVLKLESVNWAIRRRFADRLAEVNIEAAKEGHDSVDVMAFEVS
ncbi:MAG: 2-oxoacid:acceptor oxidoreductase family protein [Candidatus Bathyarchaeota archaeon]|nr:MAG: 2-oxoacid:acceptor oxidoreductase family protein [Candidatus Bathyarchaeota archaeon]